MGRRMFKRISSQFLVDLGEMEGDYRIFYLKDDIVLSVLYISIATISVLGMISMDGLLYRDSPNLFMWLIIYRGGYILGSILITIVIRKTSKARIYDRLVFTWLLITIFFLLLFNFTRPANFLTTAIDVIVPFAIYILSPLNIVYNIALAFAFSVGTLYVDYLANIDPLTKSLTRRHFFNIAESEFLRFLRYHRQLSVLVLDADDFKNINDTHGHYAGDLVLRSLSLVILEQKRAQDTFGRLGGEEFGLLLPETNLEQAKIVAVRIQKTCEQTPAIVDGKEIYSTISIGVAEAGSTDKSFEDILRRGDRMMYKAKEAGRNTVASE